MSRLISVILPFYNAEAFIKESVQSILDQSHHDFELLLIDDGATDNSRSIVAMMASDDGRIRLIDNDQKGLVSALNLGVRLARGPFIARMDADDISLPLRFEKQLHYLETHPSIDVVGSAIAMIDPKGALVHRRFLRAQSDVECTLVSRWTSPMTHPAVMMRRSVFDQHQYSLLPEHRHVEDTELWMRLIADGKKMANHPEVLLKYRLHPSSVGKLHRETQRLHSIKLFNQYWGRIQGESCSPRVIEIILNKWTVLPSNVEFKKAFLIIEQEYQSLMRKYDLTKDAKKRLYLLVLDQQLEIWLRRLSKTNELRPWLSCIRWCLIKGYPMTRLTRWVHLKIKLRSL